MKVGLTTDKWKTTIEDYRQSAMMLLASMMQQGFSPFYAVPIDPSGELLDGSHRVACAVALGIREIDVIRQPRPVWAPPWDFDWFVARGMAADDLARLTSDWELMRSC